MKAIEINRWPVDGGSMGGRIRGTDWSATSLGPIDDWPGSLRSAVDILLRLPIPAVLAWGEEGILLYNDACAAFAQTLGPDLLGSKLEDCCEESEVFKQSVRKVRRDGKALCCPDQEFTLQGKDAMRGVWLNLNYSPVPDDVGGTAGVLVIFLDTTERMEAVQALRHSERHLAAIFERAQVGLSVISREGRFLRVNDELCRMLGRSRETLLASGVADVTYAPDLDQTLKAFGHLLDTGESVSIDKRYHRPDGEIVFANSILTGLTDANGKAGAVLAVTVDLTDRRQAQEALAESEARFRALVEASPALVWQLDAHGAVKYMNARFLDKLGVSPEDMLGFGWKALLHPDDLEECERGLTQALREKKALQRRFRVRCHDGQWRWVESYATPWFSADGQYAGHVGLTVDIDDLVRAQEELMVSNERLNLAIEGSGDGIWDWNIVTGEIAYSTRTGEILDLPEGEALKHFDDWKNRIHPEDRHSVLTAVRDCLDGAQPSIRTEYRVRRSDGEWQWVLARGIVVRRDGRGKPLRMTGTVTDISEKRRAEEVVWRYANFDALTGLPNRRLFRDRLDHEVRKAHRTGQPVALLFIDLDRFKEANDLLGHDVGDQVLMEAARRIQHCVRSSDTVARLGGDEFTAVLSELDDVAHVEPVAQKINEALATPFQIGNEVLYLSASIGITLFPMDALTAENLIRNADQAMYVAKNNGRNQFSYFTPSMQREAHDRLRLIGDLRNALSRKQLKVYFQPVVDLKNGHVDKAEALLRWDHPRLGLIEPVRFIAFAEESGLITEIGDWVFKEAARRCRRWGERLGRPFQVSINKSPVQFLSRVEEVNWPEHLERLGLSGSSVSVEITEGVLLNASPPVVAKLLQYRDAGIQVAIDDFGTGYSSMAYLKKFDIDYLKIDQSFVRDMVGNEGDRAIVRSVTAMAHELGMQVIAEGIETPGQRELLIEAHCDFGQGYLFSRAMPADEFERVLCE